MFFHTFLPKLLNMSLTASVVMVLVLLARLLLKRAPKAISYALWGIVLIRLLCPVSLKSGASLFGLLDTPTAQQGAMTSSITYIPEDIVHTEYPSIVLPVPGVGEAISETLPKGQEQLVADPMEAPFTMATYVWVAGFLAMSVYAVFSYYRLRRKLITASLLRQNIYLADEIASPFVLGLFRPKIYLPSAMTEREQSLILLHEQCHIRRLDHIWKVLAFAALCIHWFNPLVWVAFFLASKDMEMSCDEAVVKKLGEEIRADYAASLLSFAIGKRIMAGMPLTFGEGNPKERILNLARWKKPAFWMVLAAAIVLIVLAVCLLTNPSEAGEQTPEPFGHSYRVSEIAYQALQFSFGYTDGDVAPQYHITVDGKLFVSSDLKEGPIWQQANGQFEEITLSPLSFNDYFKDAGNHSGWNTTEGGPDQILNSVDKAWRLTVNPDDTYTFFYLLLMDNKDVYLSQGYDAGDGPAAEESGSYIRWLFKLAPTDLITCTIIGERHEDTVQPVYYPDIHHWEEQGVAVGAVGQEGSLVFDVGWDTDELVVSEHYYHREGTSITIDKNTHELSQTSNGTFELPVFYQGGEQDYAIYYIRGVYGRYVMRVNFLPDDMPHTAEISTGTTYVSYQCIYMNPLSSIGAQGGDSGCRYTFGEDYFETETRSSGARDLIDVARWEWQPFPYTDKEWAGLYKPGNWAIQNISQLYAEILYQPLNPDKFLLLADGDLWLVELTSNSQTGTYLWSIFSLVPETAMGVAQWEYAPMLSSRSPVFQFQFELEYTEISANCSTGWLAAFHSSGMESGTAMTYPAGQPLSWSPENPQASIAENAVVRFTVQTSDAQPYHGALYIENSGGGNNGRPVYTASLVGAGLHLSPSPRGEGGVITLVDDTSDPSAAADAAASEKINLQDGDWTASMEALDRYVFQTNSEQIHVTVEKEGEFTGTVRLLDISQANAEIRCKEVTQQDCEALFTGLTASRLYLLSCEGLEHGELTISGDG